MWDKILHVCFSCKYSSATAPAQLDVRLQLILLLLSDTGNPQSPLQGSGWKLLRHRCLGTTVIAVSTQYNSETLLSSTNAFPCSRYNLKHMLCYFCPLVSIKLSIVC